MTNRVAVDKVIDNQKFSPLAKRILLICALVVLMDGFDTQAIGFAATAMSSDLEIPVQQFGSVFSAGLFGAMLGAFFLSPLADKFGRKPMLICAIAFFASFTILTSFTSTLSELLTVRFLAGIGLGGAIPNAVSLCSEYSPKNKRGLAIGLLYSGFPLGGMLGGFSSAKMIPLYGWKSIFVLGGILPAGLLIVALFAVPESWVFLCNAGRQAKLRKVMARLIGSSSRDVIYFSSEPKVQGAALKQLFTDGRAAGTVLLWIPFFMVMLLLIVMVLWTPALLKQAGISAAHGAFVSALINMGSAIGNALIGRLVDKVGPYWIIPLAIAIGAAAVAPIGMVTDLPMVLAFCAVAGGFFVGAAASGLLILAVLTYPGSMRVTGIGLAYSMGRVGQVVGPIAAGLLLGVGFKVNQIFLFSLVPATCAIIAILMLRRANSGQSVERTGESAADTVAQFH